MKARLLSFKEIFVGAVSCWIRNSGLFTVISLLGSLLIPFYFGIFYSLSFIPRMIWDMRNKLSLTVLAHNLRGIVHDLFDKERSLLFAFRLSPMVGGLIVGVLVFLIYTLLIRALIIRAGINAFHGRPATEKIFPSLKQFTRFFLVTCLYVGFTCVGICFFIVPGCIIYAMYGFAGYLVLERDMTVFHAFKISARIARGYLRKIFALSIIILLCAMVYRESYILLILITLPFMILPHVYTYCTLSHEYYTR